MIHFNPTSSPEQSATMASSVSAPVASTAAQELASRVKRCVGKEMAQVDKLLCDATSSRYAEVERLSRSAAAAGGKRLRPMLVFLSAHAVASTLPTKAKARRELDYRARNDLCAIAAAVELVHAASLVHDDVMDGASQRRHQPTIVGQTGNSAAVLLGDLLFTRAYALAARCRSTLPARRIAAAATRLCEGELRQQAAVGCWGMSRHFYRSLLLQKTGALCRVSSQLGGWRAGGSRQQVQCLARFGSQLGLAFQIHDDWLDYWGTEQVGKTLGTDLAQSKPTLPLIRLLETVSADERRALITQLEAGGPDDLAAVRAALARSQAAEYTLTAALACSQRAQQQLASLPSSAAKDCLIAVAEYSVQREV
ncbi:MAG: polyprenyl synthetase family protein [Planctomycetales bacterium]|nr:polyprenyl synthetase family protein [Planctomycetales bacterium]